MSEGTPPASSGSGALAPISTLNLTDEAHETVPVLGSVIANKYRVEELIARGGMGAVYLATHLVSGKRLALKWMLPTLGKVPGAKERFVREACATARIEHPNVVDIYDVGNDGGSVYLVMELLRGETLAQYLQRSPRVTPAEAVALLMPALRGVAAAHAQQVIHRDLKPENIFLCRSLDGEPRDPKVLDFGISKITSGDGGLDLTRSGAVMGTPYYMSPEQVRGAREVDERGDVYAFGVMLYEMLAGQRPFDAETYNQLILKIATEDPPPIPELNPDIDSRLVALVERAMARDPRQRFQSIELLALALEPFASGMQFRASSVRLHNGASSGDSFDSLKPFGRRKLVRKRFMAAGIALGCVLTGFGLWALSGVEPLSSKLGSPGVSATPAAIVPGPLAPEREPSPAETSESPSKASPAPALIGLEDQQEPEEPTPEPASAAQPPPEPRARSRAGASERERRESDIGRETDHDRRSAERESREDSDSRRDSHRPAPASGGRSRLPDDWDERLSIPTRPASGNVPAAGPLDARDLR